MLRRVYGRLFLFLSAYTPRQKRHEALCQRIKRTSKDVSEFHEDANRLIERDEKEADNHFGQNVRDTFPLADVFVDAREPRELRSQIDRAVRLVFGHPFVTPTADEYAMFHAQAAAMRSADLSRQVGAVITNPEGEVIATGCNEVPKIGGGAVWEGTAEDAEIDYRDFKMGFDSSARWKQKIFTEIFERLRSEGWLSPEKSKLDLDQLVDLALNGKGAPFKGTRAAGLLEFGRVVHAEMHALTEAARRGQATRDAILYCNTFPCHMCARHIIASGIRRVVYILPYPKSLAKELYANEIQVDHERISSIRSVTFESFVGVSPNRYLSLFEMPERRKEENGFSVEWDPGNAIPKVHEDISYTKREIEELHDLSEYVRGLN